MRTQYDLYELANAASSMRRHENAIEYATEAIAIDPGYAWAYGAFARGLIGIGKFDEAIEKAEHAIGLDPTEEWFFRLLADAWQHKGEYEKAIGYAKQAIKIDPDNPWAFRIIGNNQMAQSNVWTAIDTLTKALELDPTDEDTLVCLSLAHIKFEEYDTAEEYCREVLKINPNNSSALNNLGVCLENTKRLAEAAEAYKAAVITDPESYKSKNNTFRVVGEICHWPWLFAVPLIMALAAALYVGHENGMDKDWFPPIIGTMLSIGTSAWITSKWKEHQLKKRDPELMSLFQSIYEERKQALEQSSNIKR